MMSKAEDSQAQNRESFLRELIWERQKKEEEAARVASEMRRRRMLAEENRTKNQKRVGDIALCMLMSSSIWLIQ